MKVIKLSPMDHERPWYKKTNYLIPLAFAGVIAAGAIAGATPSTSPTPEVQSNTQTAPQLADVVAPKIVTDQSCFSVQSSTTNEEVVCLAVKNFSGFYTSTVVHVPVYGKVIGNLSSITVDGKAIQPNSDGSIDTFVDLFLKDGSNSFVVKSSDALNNSSEGSLAIDTTDMKLGYTNVDGNPIPSPSPEPPNYIPPAATAQCADGTFSYSQHRQGTCSHHGGVSVWY
jgi:hypothetical protein